MQMRRAAGKPRRGRGLRKRLGAFGKRPERGGRTLPGRSARLLLRALSTLGRANTASRTAEPLPAAVSLGL